MRTPLGRISSTSSSSLATSLGSTVHVKMLDGKNDHHKFEAAVKGVGPRVPEGREP